MNKAILYFIRHGKTEFNEKRLYCGSSDISLSSLGIEELKEKIKNTRYKKAKLNFTSGMKRANETFNLIYGQDKFSVLKGFKEFDFGDFEGKSYYDLKENKDYIAWIEDKTGKIKCPNGESKEIFYKRIEKQLNDLIIEINKKGEKEGVIVCHGGTIGTLLELFSDTEDYFYNLQPECGGGYKVEVVIDKKIYIEILEEF